MVSNQRTSKKGEQASDMDCWGGLRVNKREGEDCSKLGGHIPLLRKAPATQCQSIVAMWSFRPNVVILYNYF